MITKEISHDSIYVGERVRIAIILGVERKFNREKLKNLVSLFYPSAKYDEIFDILIEKISREPSFSNYNFDDYYYGLAINIE